MEQSEFQDSQSYRERPCLNKQTNKKQKTQNKQTKALAWGITRQGKVYLEGPCLESPSERWGGAQW